MESRRFEERGRGWADTAHATELQLADMQGGGDEDLRQKYRDRNTGPDPICRPDISVLNIVVETSGPLRCVGCLL